MADGQASGIASREPVGYVERDARGCVRRVYRVDPSSMGTSYGWEHFTRRSLICKVDHRQPIPVGEFTTEPIYEPFILDWIVGRRAEVARGE